jgi:NAD(P)H-dependent FMN reductase
MGNDCFSSKTVTTTNQTDKQYKVAVICGSLRQKSFNRGLLQAIIDTKHPHFQFIWVDIMRFPIFDEDVESKSVPQDVTKARKLIF